MQTLKLGDLLVQQGVLTAEQRDQILDAQRLRRRPFGVLAEDMFGVCPAAVERAWAEQFSALAECVDPRTFDADAHAIAAIDRRQAWQFKVLPLRADSNSMLLCTTKDHLVRAMRFAGWKLGHSCQFVLAEAKSLGEALVHHYPMAGMTPEMIARPA